MHMSSAVQPCVLSCVLVHDLCTDLLACPGHVAHSTASHMYISHGYMHDMGSRYLADTWRCNAPTSHRHCLSPSLTIPHHTSPSVSISHCLWRLSGYGAACSLSRCCRWSFAEHTWQQLALSASPKARHSPTLVSTDKALFMFGGNDSLIYAALTDSLIVTVAVFTWLFMLLPSNCLS